MKIITYSIVGILLVVAGFMGGYVAKQPIQVNQVSNTPSQSTQGDKTVFPSKLGTRVSAITMSSNGECLAKGAEMGKTYDEEFSNIQNLNCYTTSATQQIVACNDQTKAQVLDINKGAKSYGKWLLTANPAHWQNDQLSQTLVDNYVCGLGDPVPTFADSTHVLWYSYGCGGIAPDDNDVRANELLGATKDCEIYQSQIASFFP